MLPLSRVYVSKLCTCGAVESEVSLFKVPPVGGAMHI